MIKKNIFFITTGVLFAALLLVFCVSTAKAQEIKIGTQVWSSSNLDVSTFSNGDPIPEAKTASEWKAANYAKKPVWCYYDNDTANAKKYGKLYNWYAVHDSRGLAPKGWHVPSDAEWNTLADYLGGKEIAGKKLKSTSGWDDMGNGTDSCGFKGMPGGYREDLGYFDYKGIYGNWWSSTENWEGYAWNRSLYKKDDLFDRGYISEEYGLSVRLIKD